MRVKLGDLDQFYGEGSDPAMATVTQESVLQALAQKGLQLASIDRGIKGRDVWFEVESEQVPDLLKMLVALPEIGVITYGEVPEIGTYLDVPLVFEKRVRHRRR